MTNQTQDTVRTDEWKFFEKWAADNHARHKQKGRDYIDYMWIGWNARAALQSAAACKVGGGE